jgi:hypothetical protein
LIVISSDAEKDRFIIHHRDTEGTERKENGEKENIKTLR